MRTDLAMHKGLLGRLKKLGGENPNLGSMGSGAVLDRNTMGRGLHSSTTRLNLSTF